MSFSCQSAKLRAFAIGLLFIVTVIPVTAQDRERDEKADAVISKAVSFLGGDKYLNVTSQLGRGRFSVIRDGAVISFQAFHDVIVFPDKERTEFKSGKTRTVQTNIGGSGWIYDGDMETIKEQTEAQIESFKRGLRVSLDNLLRGSWRKEASLAYVGRRPSTLGRRNDVVRLTYEDGLVVEFEFAADDGAPQKAIYKRTNSEGEETVEEDRYAQFVDTGGIRSPFIIDRFTNGSHTSRINYQSVEYNGRFPDSTFAKPADLKEMKKSFKL